MDTSSKTKRSKKKSNKNIVKRRKTKISLRNKKQRKSKSKSKKKKRNKKKVKGGAGNNKTTTVVNKQPRPVPRQRPLSPLYCAAAKLPRPQPQPRPQSRPRPRPRPVSFEQKLIDLKSVSILLIIDFTSSFLVDADSFENGHYDETINLIQIAIEQKYRIIIVSIADVEKTVPPCLKDYEDLYLFNKRDDKRAGSANFSVYPVIKEKLDELEPENIFIIGYSRNCCVNCSIFGEPKGRESLDCKDNTALILKYNIYVASYTTLFPSYDNNNNNNNKPSPIWKFKNKCHLSNTQIGEKLHYYYYNNKNKFEIKKSHYEPIIPS